MNILNKKIITACFFATILCFNQQYAHNPFMKIVRGHKEGITANLALYFTSGAFTKLLGVNTKVENDFHGILSSAVGKFATTSGITRFVKAISDNYIPTASFQYANADKTAKVFDSSFGLGLAGADLIKSIKNLPSKQEKQDNSSVDFLNWKLFGCGAIQAGSLIAMKKAIGKLFDATFKKHSNKLHKEIAQFITVYFMTSLITTVISTFAEEKSGSAALKKLTTGFKKPGPTEAKKTAIEGIKNAIANHDDFKSFHIEDYQLEVNLKEKESDSKKYLAVWTKSLELGYILYNFPKFH